MSTADDDGDDTERGGGAEGDRSNTDFLVDGDGMAEMVRGGLGGLGRPDRFVLRIPSFWSGRLRILIVIASIIYAGSILPAAFSGTLTPFRVLGLVGLPLLVGAAMAYRAWKLPDEPQVVEFGDETVDLPKGADSSTRIEVDYRDLRSVVMLVRGDTEMVMIETEGYRFTFDESVFERPNGPRRMKQVIMKRVRHHPESQRILERMRAIEERSREASANATPATYALLGAMVFGFVLEYAAGALSKQMELVELGANSAPLIAEGQWWRLVSGNFLHGNFVHIFLNGAALWLLGTFLEKLTGSWRFLCVFLLSAVGGAYGSYWISGSHLSVGSSTAIYGLLGAFGMLHLRYWDELPPPYRQTTTWWAVILGLNILLSALPGIDAAAHGAGLVVGAAVYGVILWPQKQFDPTRTAPVAVKVVTAALTAFFAAGLALASNYAQHRPHPGDIERIYEYMVEVAEEDENQHRLNEIAWLIATEREVPVSRLEVAERAVRRALELNDRPAYRDTLATILYRLAREREGGERKSLLEEAIEIERKLPDADLATKGYIEWFVTTEDQKRSSYRTQLARFLAAYRDEYGTYNVGRPLPKGVGLDLRASGSRLSVSLELPFRLDQDARFLALVSNEGRRVGVFEVCVPAGAKGGVVERFHQERWTGRLGAESKVEIGLAETTAVDCGTDGVDVDFWRTASSVRRLP